MRHKRKNTKLHLHGEYYIAELIEAGHRMVVKKHWGAKWEGLGQRVQSFSYTGWLSPRDLLHITWL